MDRAKSLIRGLLVLVVAVVCLVPGIGTEDIAEAATHVTTPGASPHRENDYRPIVEKHDSSASDDADESSDPLSMLAKLVATIPLLTAIGAVFAPIMTFELVSDSVKKMKAWFERDLAAKRLVTMAFILTVVILVGVSVSFLEVEVGKTSGSAGAVGFLVLLVWLVGVIADGFMVAMGVLNHRMKKLARDK